MVVCAFTSLAKLVIFEAVIFVILAPLPLKEAVTLVKLILSFNVIGLPLTPLPVRLPEEVIALIPPPEEDIIPLFIVMLVPALN